MNDDSISHTQFTNNAQSAALRALKNFSAHYTHTKNLVKSADYSSKIIFFKQTF